MDPRFLEYYNRELRHLREVGGEFARDFPKIAGRLGLDSFECADPYVERLLEGFAFLAARVQLKIDSEFPRFTSHLLDVLVPNYLGPTPSLVVVQLQPDSQQGTLNDGFVVPRGTALRANAARGDATACEYRTGHDVTLWPFELVGLAHGGYTGDLGDTRSAARRTARATLRFRLRSVNGVPFAKMPLDRLPLFIRGVDSVSQRVFELLLASSLGVYVREPNGALPPQKPGRVVPRGLEDEDALLPSGARSFQGQRLLHEYFCLPNRFAFAELTGLKGALSQCAGTEVDLIVLLDKHEPSIEPAMAPELVALFCTPAVNLFSKRADRIHLTDRDREHHVVPDRTRPLDLEVHSVVSVTGFGTSGDVRREFAPLYQSHGGGSAGDDNAYYTVSRNPRVASARQKAQGPRSSYLGGEVFVSLVDGREGPFRSDLRQLGVNVLCTNRDLPLRMPVGEGRTDFHVESGAPVSAVRCVAGPSAPRASHPFGETTWRLINHLTLNYLSLTNAEDGRGATALRELLNLYAELADPAAKRQVEGVRTVSARPIVRRLPLDGPASFARGSEITLECEEGAFEGSSVLLLGLVLQRFFAKYVSINSFTETVIRSTQRGELVRWPLTLGRRSTV